MNKILDKYRRLSLPTKASLWYIICSLIQRGISFFTTPLFTRMLDTSSYGTIVIYNSWLEIVSIIITLQLTTGVFNKAMIKYEKDRDGYTSSSLFLVSSIILMFFLVYLISRRIWNTAFDLPTDIVVMMFADIFFSAAMSFWSIRNRFEYKYKNVVFFTMLANILGPAVSIVLIVLAPPQWKAEAKILGALIVKAVIYTIVYILIMKKGRKLVNADYWKYSIKYNLPLIPHYLSQQVLTQSDRIMINKICGSSDAGIYGVAYQLSMSIFIIVIAINNSFTPWVFESIRDKKYKEIRKVALELELLIGAACFGFTLFAPEFIYVLGGSKYMEAVWIVPPVTMSVLFQTLYSFFGNVEFYFEKTKIIMIASVICAAANILLNVWFISRYGFVAAGYTTLVCYMLYALVHYVFMLKICRNEGMENVYSGKWMWSIGFAFAALSLVVSTLYRYTFIRYALIVLGSLVTAFYCFKNKEKIAHIIGK